jgi:hypothetical protein
MGRPPIDVWVDERADAELSGVQNIGFLHCDGYVAEGLPALFVQILPDHGGQGRRDPFFVPAHSVVVGWSQSHQVPVRRDGTAALVLEMAGGFGLQCIGDLGRVDRSAEEPCEGAGDGTLQFPFETLHDTHRPLPSMCAAGPELGVRPARIGVDVGVVIVMVRTNGRPDDRKVAAELTVPTVVVFAGWQRFRRRRSPRWHCP